MKEKKILAVVCVFLAVIIIGIFLYLRSNDIFETENNLKSITYDECIQMNGEIINTLENEREFSSESILGEVEGLRCPCICVKKNNNAGFFLSE